MKPENPPAFPTPGLQWTADYEGMWPEGGMTLRDHFAGQALAGMMVQIALLTIEEGRDPNRVPVDKSEKAVATDCYAYADAMLRAREQQDDEGDGSE